MPTRAEIYWEGMLLAPLGARGERERRVAKLRVCPTCEGRLFISNPTLVALGNDFLGHDSDCETLAMFLEDIGSGGGGGGGAGTPFFGDTDAIFGSTDPVFGDS